MAIYHCGALKRLTFNGNVSRPLAVSHSVVTYPFRAFFFNFLRPVYDNNKRKSL